MSKSQQDVQQPSGTSQQGKTEPEHTDYGETRKEKSGGSLDLSGKDQSERRDTSSPKDDEYRRLSDEDVDKLVEQVVESERKRWNSKLSEVNEQAKDWEQKYLQAKENLAKNLIPKTATIGKYSISVDQSDHWLTDSNLQPKMNSLTLLSPLFGMTPRDWHGLDLV